MPNRVHPYQRKGISKSETRQTEFNDEFNNEKAEHIRQFCKSVISLTFPSEVQRKKKFSFFKLKWMRSSDEGQKVSRLITIKRRLQQLTRQKQHKKKSNNGQAEQLVTNGNSGSDNLAFSDEEMKENEIDSGTLQLSGIRRTNISIQDLPVSDLPVVDILSDENKTTKGHVLDTDCPNPEPLYGIQGDTNSIIVQEPMVQEIDPLLNTNQGECFEFSGESSDKEGVKYIQQKCQNKVVTKRLFRQEKRNTSLKRRLYEMTRTLVRQSRTITRQGECMEKLERKLKKQKEKPTVVNKLFHMEHVDSFAITYERNN